jgi:hypothetical protein
MALRKRTKLNGARAVLAAGVVVTLLSGGCATPSRLSMQAERYRIEVRIDPASHMLYGRAVLDLALTADSPPPHLSQSSEGSGRGAQRAAVEFLLHRDLKVTRLVTSGVRGRYRGSSAMATEDDDGSTSRKHLLILDEPVDAFTLFVDYEGELFQDVSAGEVPGQIHNFAMRAHIGEEGIYLAEGNWYPKPARETEAEPRLADYVLIADPVPGFELVAGAERDPLLSERTGCLAWRSPYPIDEMVLVGGPHEVHLASHNGIAIRLHLKPDQAKHAEGLIEAVRRNLDRYQPLLGDYPAREFTIVDNFFSSGFAFPTFTLLSSAVIDMGRRSQTAHGYIDHEILHCWWGNGIHVDPRGGNWCEALASYGANYYGHVLDGDHKEARRKRRNYCHFLSRLSPEKDKPLGSYGLKGGCGRGIAYQKGAMVFHMLARKIGQDNFWAAMRRFTKDYVGSYASWKDIRQVCEQTSGAGLDAFFRQWIHQGGAPLLSIERAAYHSATKALTMAVSQGEPAFQLEVPVRITHDGGTLEVVVSLSAPFEEVTVPLDVVPVSVELDPDYHVFRKVSPENIIPTTGSTRFGSAFVCVLPAGQVDAQYRKLQSVFESGFAEEERTSRTVGSIEDGALAERCALILGDAVRDPYVGAYLSALEFPVRFTDAGFDFEGVSYADSDHAVVCTVSHPGVMGGGVTVVYANSESAIPPAMLIPMYDRSLLIFKRGRPILRRDFERRTVVPVER